MMLSWLIKVRYLPKVFVLQYLHKDSCIFRSRPKNALAAVTRLHQELIVLCGWYVVVRQRPTRPLILGIRCLQHRRNSQDRECFPGEPIGATAAISNWSAMPKGKDITNIVTSLRCCQLVGSDISIIIHNQKPVITLISGVSADGPGLQAKRNIIIRTTQLGARTELEVIAWGQARDPRRHTAVGSSHVLRLQAGLQCDQDLIIIRV